MLLGLQTDWNEKRNGQVPLKMEASIPLGENSECCLTSVFMHIKTQSLEPFPLRHLLVTFSAISMTVTKILSALIQLHTATSQWNRKCHPVTDLFICLSSQWQGQDFPSSAAAVCLSKAQTTRAYSCDGSHSRGKIWLIIYQHRKLLFINQYWATEIKRDECLKKTFSS